ncbi:MAG: hypothetical protein QNJ63_11665 [Calothrix sp. MO_192.B10]|nr:hypothetical protein [Calothrix sp. MO_192.B10]
MQLFLAEELAEIGAIKSDARHLTLNGISYCRGTSFSQKVQAIAEKLCQDYIKQNIKCFLVKDGNILTLWISQPDKLNSDVKPIHPSPKVVVSSEATASTSQVKSQTIPKEKERTITYKGKTYKANTTTQPSGEVPMDSKTETPKKKRMYRGRAY